MSKLSATVSEWYEQPKKCTQKSFSYNVPLLTLCKNYINEIVNNTSETKIFSEDTNMHLQRHLILNNVRLRKWYVQKHLNVALKPYIYESKL